MRKEMYARRNLRKECIRQAGNLRKECIRQAGNLRKRTRMTVYCR